MSDLPHSSAADRNKEPILAVLRQVLAPSGRALEIAAGTGQHAACFAAALTGWTWQPTDAAPEMLAPIAARISQGGLTNVLPPLELDVMSPAWHAPEATRNERVDAIYCANMLHIAPWAACAALMTGAALRLSPGGLLITYGPYFEDDVSPAPGNVAFDQSLRARDPSWGIRRLEDVAAQALGSGLALGQRHTLPANNLLLVFVNKASA